MSFFGKEYKYESNENLEGFMKASGITGERAQKLQNKDVPHKIVKNADGSYTISSAIREVTFKSGEEFDRDYGVAKIKVKITVEGNTVTEVQKFDEKMVVTIKKEYSDTQLVETYLNSAWDGVAKVYYKA